MDSIHKFGGSIREQRQLGLKRTKPGLGTSEVQENLTNFKHGILTVVGGNSSDMKVITS